MIRRLLGAIVLAIIGIVCLGSVFDTWAAPAFNLGASRGLPVLADRRQGAELDRPFKVNDITLVNAHHPISPAYQPTLVEPYRLAPQTHAAFARMVVDAEQQGLTIIHRFGHRSYETQAQLMAANIETYGSSEEARRWVAEPGQSEHQTGLAVDVAAPGGRGHEFPTTPEYAWLRAHAHEYGFILRYPEGKEHITGIAPEPWHYRFIGVEPAAAFGPNSDLTLEEFLGGR